MKIKNEEQVAARLESALYSAGRPLTVEELIKASGTESRQKTLDVLDSIRCFFAILFLARDQKVELDQIDDDIRVTLISDVIKREKNEENSK